MERRRGWWAVGLVLGMGCDRGEQPVSAVEEEPSATLSAAPSAAPAPSAVPAPSPGLPPLAVPSAKDTIPGMTKLPVEGHRAAWISAPRGATDARPLLIYAHGAGGNAYATCQDARTLVADDAFVLCPFGTDHPLWGETYESIGTFQDEVEVGIEGGVVEVRPGQAVTCGPGEWVRYSTLEHGGAEYIAVCLPVFSLDTVYRDES